MTILNFNLCRSPVHGRRGIVSTSQPLATAAGIVVLSKGGNANAADAAFAAALTLDQLKSEEVLPDELPPFHEIDVR